LHIYFPLQSSTVTAVTTRHRKLICCLPRGLPTNDLYVWKIFQKLLSSTTNTTTQRRIEIPVAAADVFFYFYFLVFICLDEIAQGLNGAVEHFSDEHQSSGCHDEEQINPLAEKKTDQEH
jgi:hypothetical protein